MGVYKNAIIESEMCVCVHGHIYACLSLAALGLSAVEAEGMGMRTCADMWCGVL